MCATKLGASAAHKGYALGGNASSPISRAVQLPEAMKAAERFGIWIAISISLAGWTGTGTAPQQSNAASE